MPEATFTLNGQPVWLSLPAGTPLLAVLRNDCGLNGPKYGCGLGECGACMVLVNDLPARACVLSLAAVQGRRVTTLEGMRAADGTPHPVQQAFIDAQAAQCGYCTNGMVMATVALLARTPRPSDAEVRAALSHNLCRCGTHVEILRAVQRAVELAAPPALEGTGAAPPADAAKAGP